MFRYVRVKQPEFDAQVLILSHEGKLYYPVIHHTAVDQDRAVGDRNTFREHVHDVYHANIFTGSEGYYGRNGVFYHARPGSVALISPGEPHDFVTRRGSVVYSEVTFSFESRDGESLGLGFAELVSLYAGVELELPEQPMLDAALMREFVAHIVQLSDYVQRQSSLANFYAQRTLGRIFNLIITDCCRPVESGQTAENRVHTVKEYLDRHYMDQLTVDDLAEIAQLSKGYLFRAFKNTFQVSPLAYQQTLRLEAAKTLLKSTELRCNEIARRVGYENPCFFHRVFKQRVGVPPNAYRRNGAVEAKN